MTSSAKRWASRLTAPALLLGGITLGTAAAPTIANAATVCEAPASSVTVFSYNDFHGRVEGAAALFTVVENERDAKGDGNVVLLSSGDDIGGSTFTSMIQQDVPTLDVMNAIEVDVATTGNHEYDKGWADLNDRIIPYLDMPVLGANVYDAGTTNVAGDLEEYALVERGGLKIAVIGAVTEALPTLVSPGGMTGIEIGSPAEAINRVAAELATDATIDVIIASIHEGAPDANASIEENIAASGAFAEIAEGLSADVDVIFNGHTHKRYAWETANGTPILQAGEYAGHIAKIELGVDADGNYCGLASSGEIIPAAGSDAIGTQPRIEAIKTIVADAVEVADELGSVGVGFANTAVSTPLDGGNGKRDVESPMSNMVAEMFFEVLGDGNDEFIGIQNPGGTRDSFDRGIVTYMEAAEVLPFANSLMTTEVTGAQFKKALEQQWQRTADGNPIDPSPSRPFLALGLSSNVSYTMDESRAWGDRITSVSINGEPIDMAKSYTVGSGSFLVSGGDNFWEFGNGTNTRDTGRVDLEAWVSWIEGQDALEPDYSKRGVNLTDGADTLTQGAATVEFTLGQPLADGMQIDTLDMLLNDTGGKVSPQLANTDVTAWIGDEIVGGGEVVDGVATVDVGIPHGVDIAAGANQLYFVVEPSGTVVAWPVNVVLTDAPTTPVDVYITPGIHNVNDRRWMTACEPYSITERCWTYIHATTVEQVGGQFIQRNGWAFNNLTYKASPREAWANNPLGNTGSWTTDDGRQWRTECDTALTGRGGCRSFIQATVVEAADGQYRMVTKEVFNNMVRFSN